MPAPSMASVSIRSVFGESSTTSTILRCSTLAIMTPDRLQGGDVTLEIEAVDEHSQVCGEVCNVRENCFRFGELFLDRADEPI
jgi:hypothetical protein